MLMLVEKILRKKTVYSLVSTIYSESDVVISDSSILKRKGLYLCTGMNVYTSKEEALKDMHEYLQNISNTYENVVITIKDDTHVTVRYEDTFFDNKFRLEYSIVETKIIK